jgi:hypothetical protein
MSNFLSMLGKVASPMLRGFGVTFGSTVFSIAMACEIEIKANRMIYTYFPHKFAYVERANGISQEELDFVHMYYGGAHHHVDVTRSKEQQQTDDAETICDNTLVSLSTTVGTEIEESNEMFQYREEDQYIARIQKTKKPLQENSYGKISKITSALVGIQNQEILACSMTA